jgi:hypothetical protein
VKSRRAYRRYSGACIAAYTRIGLANVYFDLTREFNRYGAVAALASGQAVVYYRVAIMSKDGDWILHETPEACERVRAVLSHHGARHRPAAPLDLRWLRGGWSSHFEYLDAAGRRIRCDFVTRPPRVSVEVFRSMFAHASEGMLLVVDRETLIKLKQTGRAKDYAVIGELARQLPPEEEIEWTTDVDRILELAADVGVRSNRRPVRTARSGAPRAAVVASLAQEIDDLQQSDRQRVAAYQRAAEDYLAAFRRLELDRLPLAAAHFEACRIAEALLPESLDAE